MSSAEDITNEIIETTLKVPNFRKALRFAFTYLDALSVTMDIDETDIILELSKKDRRFKKARILERKIIPAERFNVAGEIYLGREFNRDVVNNNRFGILLIYDKGLLE